MKEILEKIGGYFDPFITGIIFCASVLVILILLIVLICVGSKKRKVVEVKKTEVLPLCTICEKVKEPTQSSPLKGYPRDSKGRFIKRK